MAKNVNIAVIISAYDRMTRVVNATVGNAERKLKALKKTSDAVASGGFEFGQTMGAAGLTGAALLAGPIKAAADMERMNIALRTSFQGNKVAADAAFKTINEFAARTPYSLEEVMRGFVKLKNMGLDPGTTALTAYGNTASAMGKSLNDMVEAVADAATGEFERLKEFGIKASSQGDKVKFTFQGVTTTVAKNAKDIERYLTGLGNTKFAGGIAAQADSVYGRWSTAADNVKMSMAKLGATVTPIIIRIFDRIGPIIDRISAWIDKNPELAKGIMVALAGATGLAFALSGIGFAVGGVMKLVSAFSTFGTVITTVTRFMLANPILLIIAAIATAAFLIYRNWGAIKQWFINLWNGVKAGFLAAWNWIKNLFLNYTPHGLVIKHWDKIVAFFGSLWDRVKTTFSQWIDWVFGIHKRMYQAGVNIVGSIWEGIKSKWSQFVGWWEKKIQDVRDFLPFSPAKRGPLRDIHRIKLVETIAQAVKPNALTNAMQQLTLGVAGFAPAARPQMAGAMGGGGGMSLTVNFQGAASRDGANAFVAELRRNMPEIFRLMQAEKARTERRKF